MKKGISLLLTFMVLLPFTSCGKKNAGLDVSSEENSGVLFGEFESSEAAGDIFSEASDVISSSAANSKAQTSRLNNSSGKSSAATSSAAANPPAAIVEKRGNSIGNHANSSEVAFENGVVYYLNYEDDKKLYSFNLATSQKKKLTDAAVASINVLAGWLYFIDQDHYNGYITCMRTDGAERKSLNNVLSSGLMVVNDWIYYTRQNPESINGGGGATQLYLCRMRLDGSSDTVLITIPRHVLAGTYCVTGGKIYYHDIDGGFWMRNDDGSNPKKLLDLGTGTYVQVEDGMICYFDSYDMGWAIYRVDISNAKKEKLPIDTAFVQSINVFDGWIYGRSGNFDGKLWKSKLDGSGFQTMDIYGYSTISIADGWIYTQAYTDQSVVKHYRVRTDGTGKQEF